MDWQGIGRVAANTTLAACAGGFVAVFFVYPRSKKWDLGISVNGFLGGLVANPPLVDEQRRLAVAYDSGNGVMACFDADTLELRWRREQDHASHLLLYAASGELVTGDGNDVVVLDIESGSELARVDPGHGIQSVLFPCPGTGRDFYVTSFIGVSRIEVVD